jgi:carboxymethylenebutenolidase
MRTVKTRSVPPNRRVLALSLGLAPSLALALSLTLAALAGCARGPSSDAAREKPPAGDAATPQTGAPPRTAEAPMGGLSEEEFKALHELSQEKAPAAQGTMIDLAGTRAYLSLPKAGAPPFPALVVVHEWWGLNDHIKHWADRLAADGYAALAVDLYEGRVAETPDSAMAYMKRVDQKRATETLLAAHAFLASDDRVRAVRRAAIGWCFGGGQSLRLAIAAPDLDAAVMYYGFPVEDPAELAKIKAHLLGIFANQDKAIPPSAVDAFDAALETAGVSHQILRFDADHAFANPSGGRYDGAAAAAAWAATREFLEDHVRRSH